MFFLLYVEQSDAAFVHTLLESTGNHKDGDNKALDWSKQRLLDANFFQCKILRMSYVWDRWDSYLAPAELQRLGNRKCVINTVIVDSLQQMLSYFSRHLSNKHYHGFCVCTCSCINEWILYVNMHIVDKYILATFGRLKLLKQNYICKKIESNDNRCRLVEKRFFLQPYNFCDS